MIRRCNHQDSDWDSLALGALTPVEAAPLLAHLQSGCRICQALYRESENSLSAIPATLADAEPSQAVEARLAGYVREKHRKAKVIEFPLKLYLPWAVAAASVVLTMWVASQRPEPVRLVEVRTEERLVDPNPELLKRIAQLEQQSKVAPPVQVVEREREKVVTVADPRVAQLEAEIARLRQAEPVIQKIPDLGALEQVKALQAKVTELESKLAQQARQNELLLARHERESRELQAALVDYRNAFRTIESTGMRQVELARVDAQAGKSGARALYSREGGLLVLAHGLPQLPERKCYQLWILRKGNPSIVSGGLMKLDDQGRGYLQSPPTAALRDATGFAITDEPEGGSVVARGRKLLFGAL